ncbi:zeta toxin family protein [Luteipulveratus halotolerans]|uniref:zeta toxin family protein n=1 Tax=Luteipulveratus halotolerans TaxID=1631356 RepID=UPI000681935C|nr:zeta toxin family protein [Luteipulveratus halotolerans]
MAVDLEQHQRVLTELAAPEGPLTATGRRATVNNPAWFGNGRPRPQRAQLHDRFLAEHRQAKPDAKADRQAVVLAGPPGAGKTSSLDRVLAERGSSRDEWLVINSDDFKDAILLEALRDGTYDAWLKDAQVRAAEARGHEFQPREFASLVHEESGRIAKDALQEAVGAGMNVVVDGTLSNRANAQQLLENLYRSGYSVTVVDVECTRQQSEGRAHGRWRDDRLAMEAGTGSDLVNTLGGRWVPSEVTSGLFPTGSDRSVAADVVDHLESTYDVEVIRYQLPEGAAVPERMGGEQAKDPGAQRARAFRSAVSPGRSPAGPSATRSSPGATRPFSGHRPSPNRGNDLDR